MTKEQLRQYPALKREIEQIQQQMEAVESRLYSPKAQQLTGMPSAKAPESPLEGLMDKHARLQALYAERLEELTAQQLAIEAAINGLADPTLRQLLRYRYLDGLTWEQVCIQIGYSWRQTHNLHAKALQELRTPEEAKEEEDEHKAYMRALIAMGDEVSRGFKAGLASLDPELTAFAADWAADLIQQNVLNALQTEEERRDQ